MSENLPWELEARLKLNAATFLGPGPKRRLLETFGKELWTASDSAWARAAGLTPEAAARLKDHARSFDAAREWDEARRLGIRILSDQDSRYPDLLRSLPEAPLALYVRGDVSEQAVPVAFVGSRHPTPYGRRMTRLLAGEAAANGLAVVSGLARGIDTEAHQAAFAAGGVTWAVLGSGLARVYPPENERLASSIAESGAVISEFPLETAPLPGHFPLRNRIISGLSWATVIVEGKLESGSLITARRALEQGRSVLAVPGPADGALSAAPHSMIRQGARLMTGIDDLLDELPPAARSSLIRPCRSTPSFSSASTGHSTEEACILKLLEGNGMTLEEIGRRAAIDFQRLSTIIFDLELRNLVVSVPGQRYALR